MEHPRKAEGIDTEPLIQGEMHFRHLRVATVFTSRGVREKERVNTVFNPQSSVTHPQWFVKTTGEPPEKLNMFNFSGGGRGGLKWTVFIRVRNAVNRVKNAIDRDNNVITPCYTAVIRRS